MMHKRSIIGTMANTFAAAFTLMAATAVQAQDAMDVSVHTVAKQDVREIVEFPTRLRAQDATRIVPRVSGTLSEKTFESGSVVKKGDLLYLINPEDYLLAKEQREAELKQAQAALEIAEKNFSRAEVLADKSVLSKARMDEIQSNYINALNQVASAERELERANLYLGYTEIRAERDGVITNEASLSLGDLVGPEAGALGTLDVIDPIRAWIHVDEKLDGAYAARQLAGEIIEFDFRLELAGGFVYPEGGRIVAFDNQVDVSTGTRAIQIEFPNPSNQLTPGMAGTVLGSEVSTELNLAIPQIAVLQDQRGLYVFEVGVENALVKTYPEFGPQVDGWWMINDGLTEGAKIVTNNLQRIGEGMTVNPVAE